MNPLKRPDFLRLNRKEIVYTCVMTPLVGTRAAVKLNAAIAVDLNYYGIRWENGVETVLAVPANQSSPNSRQIVEARAGPRNLDREISASLA